MDQIGFVMFYTALTAVFIFCAWLGFSQLKDDLKSDRDEMPTGATPIQYGEGFHDAAKQMGERIKKEKRARRFRWLYNFIHWLETQWFRDR